ncbi:uncharacterized protein LOC116344809 [Contarinia nasturtii]|uniref:uncharacterized protein LOC116344809 n=1 Tax=Contarinia nasturtii TaxID=265458 RepID=UPI0012D3E164|nr:uncharacterized protein LOC116344809 [Contarinia nasturtii]
MLTTILRRIPQVASIQRIAVSVAGYSQENYNRSVDNNKNCKYTKPNSVDNYMTNSVNSSLSSGRNDGPILYHDEALSADQHDMVLTDINRKDLADENWQSSRKSKFEQRGV